MNNQIIKGVGRGFKKITEETVEKLTEESQKVLETTISGRELLGLDGGLGSNQIAYEQEEDEIKKQEEIRRIKSEMGLGRKVEEEMEQLRQQKEKEEEEKEKFFEEEKRRREAEEEAVLEANNDLMKESINPAKQKKSRGSALARKKKSQPDQSQMSQTQEFKGKIN